MTLFSQYPFFVLLSFTLPLVVSFLITKILINELKRNYILDHPNERSSHTAPTPRGAGWAILLTCTAYWTYLTVKLPNPLISDTILPLALSVLLLTIVSFYDDVKSLKSSTRFIVQILAVLITYTGFETNQLFFQGLFPLWIDRILIIIAWLWWLNLFNFMDGIDGITGLQTLFLCSCFAFIFYHLNVLDLSLYCISLSAATIGFLAWNWHPARIFLGDVGSITLGFTLGWLMLQLLVYGYWLEVLILPAYYWSDATLTLLKRLMRGEPIHKPHKQHFYQRPISKKVKPPLVCLIILASNLCLAGFLILYHLDTINLYLLFIFCILCISYTLFQLQKIKNNK